MSRHFEAGNVLAGRYRLVGELGRGGMGSVWRADHLSLRSPVAIKLIDPSIAGSREAVARFMREAQAAAALRGQHVVQILDHGVDGEVPYMVMELLQGESLARRLERGRLSAAATARVVLHVARAIGKAHETGIVHRDLKPDNIFLVGEDDEEIAKVLDFGIAKATGGDIGPSGATTRTGAVLGTPYYMSPEQTQGKSIDFRTDLWSLGVIAYECLTGVRPFQADVMGELVLQICMRALPVPSQVAPVPRGFDEWFARAAAREPEDRFPSARAMADALRAIADAEPAGSVAAEELATGKTMLAAAATSEETPAPKLATTTRGGAVVDSSGVPRDGGGRRVVIGAGIGAAAVVVGVGAWLALRAPASEAEAAEPVTAPPASAAHATAAAPPAVPPPEPQVASAVASEAPSTPEPPPSAGVSRPKPVAPSKPAAPRASAPAAATAAPPAKRKVDLGI